MKDIRLEGLNTEFEWSYPNQLRFRRVVDFFQNYQPKNLLDIGCGNGFLTGKVRDALHLDMVDGIDIMADKITSPQWLRLLRVDIDKEDLPYPNNSFDAVHCSEVLEHVYDVDHLLDEIYRVLSPKGVCILTTPNLASWVNRLVLLMGFQPFSLPASVKYERAGELKFVYTLGHRGHFRVLTSGSLREILGLHSFKIVKFEGWSVGNLDYYVHPKILSRFMEFVDWTFARIPSLAYRTVVVISKEI